MAGFTPQALDVLQRHHGIATSAMLAEAGVGKSARQRLVAKGLLMELHKGVYRIGSSPLTLFARCAALCLAHRSSFITGPTGGTLVGLRRMPRSPLVHLAVPHGCNIAVLPGVHLRQTTNIAESDVQHRPDGIVIASPARLAFDLGADLTAVDHASVVEQLLHDRRCGFASIVVTARRLMHPGRPGSLVVAGTLEQRRHRAPSESHPEVLLADALRRRGVPVEPQHRLLALPDGSSIRIDLAVTEARWAVEIDVHPDHLLLEGTSRDKARDRQCHLVDWQVDRVTSLDLVDLEGIADELATIYRRRMMSIVA
jgi:hypothetical protein